jgi:hypothetical protein
MAWQDGARESGNAGMEGENRAEAAWRRLGPQAGVSPNADEKCCDEVVLAPGGVVCVRGYGIERRTRSADAVLES